MKKKPANTKSHTGAVSGPVRVEYLPLDRLVRAPRNPKGHALGALAESYKRFGSVAPILLDDRTGSYVAAPLQRLADMGLSPRLAHG